MIESYLRSLNIHSLKLLNGFHNRVYEGVYDNRPIVIRVSERRCRKAIEEEVRVLNHIKKKVSVGEPWRVGGNTVHTHQDKTLAFFKKAEGLNWHQVTMDASTHFHAGKTLGMLHKTMQELSDVKRESYYEHPDLKLLQGVNPVYDKVLENLLGNLESHRETPRTYGLIHGDYLFSNLLYRKDGLTVIDFDDMEYGYYLYDIAVYLFYLLLGGDPSSIDLEPNKEVFRHFMRGYRETFPTAQLDFTMIQSLFRLRQLKLLATIKRTMAPSNLGPWQKAYIALCDEQFHHDQAFVGIDYQSLYERMDT
ncbi:MAG: phosphotransferase enzyme family protein [Bacillota bacterium]